jgi:hypothetical protein
MTVVVVESPAKAKTINKYLGSGYTVLASYGHVRDLPSKDGSVRPDDDFAMEWSVDPKSKKHLDAIASRRPPRRQAVSGDRPRPGRRGDLLACRQGAGRAQGAERRRHPPGRLQRDHA